MQAHVVTGSPPLHLLAVNTEVLSHLHGRYVPLFLCDLDALTNFCFTHFTLLLD
jgi:hypothetical protein